MGKKGKKSKNTLLTGGRPVFEQEVCVIGAGYVGVVTAAVLASKHPHIKFTVADVDGEKIKAWQTSEPMPINEPDLQDLIVQSNLEFSNDVEDALLFAKVIFLAVGPPAKSAQKALLTIPKPKDWIFDVGPSPTALSEIVAAIINSQRQLERTIVIRSTMPPGTAGRIEEMIHASTGSYTAWDRLHVYVNPELLAQGTAVKNFSHPDAIVLGAATCSSIHSEAFYNLRSLYSSWVPEERILTMSASSAALFKLANNALLAQQLSTMNALAMICTAFNEKNQIAIDDRLDSEEKATRPGSTSDLTSSECTSDVNSTSYHDRSADSFRRGEANVTDVIEALSRNTRLSMSGNGYFQPGLGFGGSCLQKSASSLATLAVDLALPHVYATQFNQTIELNKTHFGFFFRKILNACDHKLYNKKFAVIGLTYKVGTDDVRESTAKRLIHRLLEEGAHAIDVYDPLVTKEAFRSCFKERADHHPPEPVTLRRYLHEACMLASCVIIVNAYPGLTRQDPNEYRRVWATINASLLHPKIIFDTRNCLNHSILRQCEGEPVRVVGMGGTAKPYYDRQQEEQGARKDDSSTTAAETP